MDLHKFILGPGMVKSDVQDVVMQFFPGEYKNMPVSVRLEGRQAVASYGGKTAVAPLTSTVRNGVKKSVYQLMAQMTGKTFSWGTSTGVKPVQMTVDLLEEGKSAVEIEAYFQEELMMNGEKTRLLLDTARRQRPYWYPPKDNLVGLYINIPFCPNKCAYCSFPSQTVREGDKVLDDYLELLERELESIRRIFDDYGFAADVIYMGGGTPTVLTERQLERLLGKVEKLFFSGEVVEFTCEAGRCDTITQGKLRALKDGGVSRVCINPQSTNREYLAMMGRELGVEDFFRAYELGKEAGFQAINCDLIAGFPGQKNDEFLWELEQIARLEPENVTVHSLCRKRCAQWETDRIGTDDEQIAGLHQECRSFLRKKGYEPYYLYKQKFAVGSGENIGYAREGMDCIYNVRMMGRGEHIFAVGASSSGKIVDRSERRFERVESLKNALVYLQRGEEGILKKEERYRSLLAGLS